MDFGGHVAHWLGLLHLTLDLMRSLIRLNQTACMVVRYFGVVPPRVDFRHFYTSTEKHQVNNSLFNKQLLCVKTNNFDSCLSSRI